MIATITGDIVNSQSLEDPSTWMNPVKEWFRTIGKSPEDWQIYRGDSFQLIADVEDSLRIAVVTKSVIKRLNIKTLDVRLAIGIGKQTYRENSISEASGDAFLFSGQLLDQLKDENIHLGIRTPNSKLNKELNMMFKLALVIMNSWTSKTAEVAKLLFSKPGMTQVEMAERLGIAQSTINERLKRGAVHEIVELERYYRERIGNI